MSDFTCECGEVFDLEVWHCPRCDHHWSVELHDDECKNCRLVVRDPDTGTLSTPEMSEGEARYCCTIIRTHLDGARTYILALHERRGWAALGYESWRECVMAEFGFSQPHSYQLLKAAQVERDISSTEEIGSIPERQLRPLGRLDSPDERRAAWSLAVEMTNGHPTARDVEAAVREIAPRPDRDGIEDNPSLRVDPPAEPLPGQVEMEFREAPEAFPANGAREAHVQWGRIARDFWAFTGLLQSTDWCRKEAIRMAPAEREAVIVTLERMRERLSFFADQLREIASC